LDTTEQPRLAEQVLRARVAETWPEVSALPLSLLGQILRLMAAVVVSVVVFKLAGQSEHPLTAMKPGPYVTFVSVTVPAVAAVVTAFALYRPWHAILVVLALTPFWNAAYIGWYVGPVQVILQTVFVLAIAVGAFTPSIVRFASSAYATYNGAGVARPGPLAAPRRMGFAAVRLAEVAVVAFIGIAVLSTIASRNVSLSSTDLLHGILEPIALAALVVYMKPSRRDLVVLVVALGMGIAIGTVFNLIETLPTTHTFSAMQADRLYFARASYYNVGLFATAASTIIPVLVAAVATRSSLAIPRWATALLLLTLALGLTGLFLSFSKSAWLGTAIAIVLVLVMILRTWRRRIALIVASAAVSTLFLPWPALFLQAAPAVNDGYRAVMTSLVGEQRFDSWNPATLAGRGSLSERYYAVDAAVQMALANPVLGVGLDQFGPNYFNPVYRPAAAQDVLDHAHSFFPEIAAELGIGAAALVFVIYAAALWAMLRIYRAARDQLTRVMSAGLAAAIVGWLVVATAFGCDIYRPTRELSSDVVASVVILGAAVALARLVQSEKDDTRTQFRHRPV
jgi:O-antigen ligase